MNGPATAIGAVISSSSSDGASEATDYLPPMHVSALARREPIHDILALTLSRAWSEQFGRPVRVERTAFPGAQEWRLHESLSAYTHRSIARPARRFLADNNRYTRSRSKLPARWVRGTLAASRAAQVMRQVEHRLWVDPPLEDPGQLVIAPGNQRVRIFDLRTGAVRAVLKDGFDPAAMRTEIEVRASGNPGPFVPITDHDPGGAWFEEPLVDGFSLASCPPWRPYPSYLRRAAVALDEWQDRSAEPRDAGAHATEVAGAAHTVAARLEEAHGWELARRVAEVAAALTSRAQGLGVVPHAWSHGDLQPGNIVVARADEALVLVDWEACAWRLRWYDALVHELLRRVDHGRPERLAAFVRDGRLLDDLGLVPDGWDRPRRDAVAAAVVLEDLAWALREAAAGRAHVLPRTVERLLAEAEAFTGLEPPS